MLIYHSESDSLFWDANFKFEGADGALCNDVTGIPEWEIRAKKEGIVMGWGTGAVPEVIKGASIAAPPPDKPKASRNPRAKKVAQAAVGIIDALTFIEDATENEDHRAYVRVINNWVIAFDGGLAAAHPIEADLALCPHLKRLKEAVGRAGASLSLSAQENGRLTVAGDGCRFTVPCVPGSALAPVMPDPQIAVLDDRLKAAMGIVLKLAKDDAERVFECSVLLRAGSVVGCNGNLALEAWHGIDLPPGLGIPHKAAKAIAKQSAKLTGFGFDYGRSATFYFENGAWIKTQLMMEAWPDIDRVLNQQVYFSPCPEKLFDALDKILSFSEDGAVHFHEDKLRTTYGENEAGALAGATYDVPGLAKGSSFTGSLLKLIAPFAKEVDYTTNPDHILFIDREQLVRGTLTKRRA